MSHLSRFPSQRPHTDREREREKERCSISSALFYCLSNSLVNIPPLQLPQWGPYGERCPSPEPSFIYPSGSTVKKPSLQVPLAEPQLTKTFRFQSPLLRSLEVPSKRTSPLPPKGPIWREIPVSRAFFYTSLTAPTKKTQSPDRTKSHFSLKVPSKGAHHSMFPQRGPYGQRERERDSISRANGLVIHSYLSKSPVKELSPEMEGKHTGRRPRSHKWTEGLHTMGCGLVPQGDHLQHCYYYTSAIQPSAYLPL